MALAHAVALAGSGSRFEFGHPGMAPDPVALQQPAPIDSCPRAFGATDWLRREDSTWRSHSACRRARCRTRQLSSRRCCPRGPGQVPERSSRRIFHCSHRNSFSYGRSGHTIHPPGQGDAGGSRSGTARTGDSTNGVMDCVPRGDQGDPNGHGWLDATVFLERVPLSRVN